MKSDTFEKYNKMLNKLLKASYDNSTNPKLTKYFKKHKVNKLTKNLIIAVEKTVNSYASLAAEWDIEDEEDYDDFIGELQRKIDTLINKTRT